VGIRKRSMIISAVIGAIGVIVAGGTISPAMAATTSGVRYQMVQHVTMVGPNGTECNANVLSAEVSAGRPAYASAVVTNDLPATCTGWLQSSVKGGAWKDVSPRQSLTGRLGLDNPTWDKTANYYAGPGTRIRACILVAPTKSALCTGPVSLAASTAKPANDGTSVFFAQKQKTVSIIISGPPCLAFPSSDTKSKTGTSRVNLTLEEIDSPFTCTGWLESSTNNGKTWAPATATYSVVGSVGLEYAFSPAVADGTGRLVRACIKVNAGTRCSAGW
jgi:hypothetical protein